MVDWLGPIIGIVLIDLVLSGDNAVVIGAAASTLPPRQRLTAIVLGGGGAIVLRIFFALAATILLQLPYLGVVGGIILLVIAIRLLADRPAMLCHSKHNTHCIEEKDCGAILASKSDSKGLFMSICMILLADVMMSLDNVLAIAGLAGGNLIFLIGGLVLSITVLLTGSALVAALIVRLPWLLDIACLVIGWTAANIFLGDDTLQPFFQCFPGVNVITYVIVTIVILTAYVYFRKRVRKPNH
jgi:YjbE family integral membrane protein